MLEQSHHHQRRTNVDILSGARRPNYKWQILSSLDYNAADDVNSSPKYEHILANAVRFKHQVFPEITWINYNMSADSGKMPLVLRGSGFSTNISRISITIGNAPCTVVQSSGKQITCLTPVRPSNAPVRQLYLGSRGIVQQYWGGLGSGGVETLRSSPKYQSNSAAGTQFVRDIMESTLIGMNRFGQRLQAFFVAPTTGSYVFYIAAYEMGELWITDIEAGGTPRMVRCGTYSSSLACPPASPLVSSCSSSPPTQENGIWKFQPSASCLRVAISETADTFEKP
ncbi:hypothetical protein CBR_g42088 [Chara braunii]|uniref:IPT/TIG domain-containing protein n=1 Tax=Chara braunii TaxID=69332 RepID=A0A388LX08_CHABU|nr:hypothetical protein CBR_g42088 [Chara braunii]|eukprot:GBG86805.1 hypothetical protein CBR_g42088 [Chara braunii]